MWQLLSIYNMSLVNFIEFFTLVHFEQLGTWSNNVLYGILYQDNVSELEIVQQQLEQLYFVIISCILIGGCNS